METIATIAIMGIKKAIIIDTNIVRIENIACIITAITDNSTAVIVAPTYFITPGIASIS